MTGIERSEVAAKTPIHGMCPPESRAGDQNLMAVGEVVGSAGGKVVAVEIRKPLRL